MVITHPPRKRHQAKCPHCRVPGRTHAKGHCGRIPPQRTAAERRHEEWLRQKGSTGTLIFNQRGAAVTGTGKVSASSDKTKKKSEKKGETKE